MEERAFLTEVQMKKQIKVVAAIIENEQEEILCALRSPSMMMPNMWEFPGGKVEEAEDLHTAIKREIQEELGCIIEPEELHNEHVHEYETFIIQLISMRCRLVEGTPIPTEHSKLLWLKRENLPSLVWAPADIPAVELLMKEWT
jgi:8-oxo-dGTP diphosphatase